MGAKSNTRSRESAREWMLEMIRSGQTDSYKETPSNEVLGYVNSRLKTWNKRLFGSKFKKFLIGAAVVAGVAIPPLGGAMLAVGVTALKVGAIYETGRATVEAGRTLVKKEYEKQKKLARERKVREQLA